MLLTLKGQDKTESVSGRETENHLTQLILINLHTVVESTNIPTTFFTFESKQARTLENNPREQLLATKRERVNKIFPRKLHCINEIKEP